ncbi:hypothetical protein QAD02_002744 [Eretmocerus hayati]|uniref:Uncharacterized protein n=1 Tax=Eretmocerus hayati TaxID=131215 RepID=A0ACC2NJS0_9HYME|nr:hypothetical protein QAD02_002744 [Eretmocerus hayati]
MGNNRTESSHSDTDDFDHPYSIKDAQEDGLYSSDDEIDYGAQLCRFGYIDRASARKSAEEKLFELVQIKNTVTPASLLRLILDFSFRTNMCFSEVVNLSRLFNLVAGQPILPSTRYMFDKLCGASSSHTLHAVCPKCSSYVGKYEKESVVTCSRYGFCVEYMHQYDGGSAKTITKCILRTLTPAERSMVDEYMKKIRVPTQVGRLARPLSAKAFYECRDWENWVLYYSIPILSEVLDDERILKHWGLLVDSLHTILRSDIRLDDLLVAKKKLEKFVSKVEDLYSLEELTHNMHQLLHLIDSILNWGPAWAHSAFLFESENAKLLKYIHSQKGVILQILRFIQLHRFEQMLEHRSDDYSSAIVDTYLEGLSNRYSSVVKEIIGHSDEELVPTHDIISICAQIDIENKKYIIPLPNLLHY